MDTDVLIIGAGPAGLTASIYCARAGLNVTVIEKMGVGGQAALTYEIENYPAVGKISGMELTTNMFNQAESFGVKFVYDSIKSINLVDKIKNIETDYSGIINAKAVILCMGATPTKLDLLQEEKLTGRGVSYCATCDGAFYKNKAVAVIGGGNTAVEDALYLTKFASKVYLVHRRDQFRATQILADKVRENAGDKLELVLNSTVSNILGDKKVSGIVIKNKIDGNETTINLDGVFVAIGQSPQNEIVKDKVNINQRGYIKTDSEMKTNIEGVYAAGDVIEKPLRQVVTACSDGAIAAEAVAKFLALEK